MATRIVDPVAKRTHPMMQAVTLNSSIHINGREVGYVTRYIGGVLDGWYFFVEGCPHRLVLTGASITNHVLTFKGTWTPKAMDDWCATLIMRHLEKCDLED